MGRPSFYDSDPDDKWGFVYALFDPRNDEPFYVGVTTQRLCNRFAGHMTDARKNYSDPKSNVIRAILALGLKPEIQPIEKVTKTSWAECERRWIRTLRERGFSIVNLCEGGTGIGNKRTEETKQRQREAALGRDMSHVHRPAVRELVAMKLGYPVVIEGVRYRSIAFAAKQLGVCGSTLRYQLGFGKPNKGRPTGARHHNSKPVELDGVIYATGRAAAKALGITPSSVIGRIRRGKARYVDSDLGVFG